MRIVACELIVVVCASACGLGRGPVAGIDEIVAAYIVADTTGRLHAAAALAEWSDCEWVPSTDTVEPVSAVDVVGRRLRNDTTLVSIRYSVLGRASGATFSPSPGQDTVVVPVAVNSEGQVRLQCGEYHPNHISIAEFERGWVPYLDSLSQARWQEARDAAAGARSTAKRQP